MFKKKDIRIEYFRASGPGGQRRNKKETAVRVTHLPTGINALGTESRHRSRNLKAALSRLRERLDAERRISKTRVPTRPTMSALERRLVDKKLIGRKKSLRGKVNVSED
jgi:protein subunit release factor A